MTISLNNARRLCTKPEFELVEASKIVNMKQLTPARLQQKVGRARRLRDKYRDLAKRQRLEARGKQAPRKSRPSQGHENTERKAQLFQEVLERFETGLARAAAGGAKAGVAKAGVAKAGVAGAAAEKAAPSKAGAAAMKGARQRPAKRGPQDAKQKAQGTVARAHTQAANRRSQRKRDSGGR
jgi:hypothetical protein